MKNPQNNEVELTPEEEQQKLSEVLQIRRDKLCLLYTSGCGE